MAALLLHKAIGQQLTCVFVDTGVMRKDEMKQVQDDFAPFEHERDPGWTPRTSSWAPWRA